MNEQKLPEALLHFMPKASIGRICCRTCTQVNPYDETKQVPIKLLKGTACQVGLCEKSAICSVCGIEHCVDRATKEYEYNMKNVAHNNDSDFSI
jgi:hypothetical protein